MGISLLLLGGAFHLRLSAVWIFAFTLAYVGAPRWLTTQGRPAEALAVLSRVAGRQRAQVEMKEIEEAIAAYTRGH